MSREAVAVSTLVHYLKKKLDSDALLQNIPVLGEISNFINHRSGHWYFTLKDQSAGIRCVMFASSNERLDFIPKNGDQVLVNADATVYEAGGQMQLIITDMKPYGLGELYLKYEALKKKLNEEGLFEPSHKKPIPHYPMRICLITGKNTAARSDVLSTMARRWPIASIDEIPVLVQGDESAAQIISALKKADKENYDVILLVRGGGSIEDLWSFNDEGLARTIYAMQTPLITGIGHEVDTTIADYAADLRAPTPTGAAELCSPMMSDVLDTLHASRTRMINDMRSQLKHARTVYQKEAESPVFQSPQRLYAEKVLKLNMLSQKLDQTAKCTESERNRWNLLSQKLSQEIYESSSSLQKEITQKQTRLNAACRKNIAQNQKVLLEKKMKLASEMQNNRIYRRNQLEKEIHLLDAYSPLKVLERGYSVVLKDGHALTSADEAEINDRLKIRLAHGSIEATANKIDREGTVYGKGKENI